jgi:GNAT superfamily N-acetyltransferase
LRGRLDLVEAEHVDVAETAVAWAAAEGWNPGLDDAERFRAADPGAFIATEEAGEIIATVSCALYGEDYAFIGFYIVRPDLRGRGIGGALFDRALARAEGRIVGLDGVLEQQPYYERRGFVLEYRNTRFRTSGGGERPAGLVELSSVPFEELQEFDAAIFGARRERFLRGWIDCPPEHALAFVRNGSLAGYGVLRPCRVGAKVGPLLAEDDDVAEALFAGLLATAGPGTEVFLDIPAPNERARSLNEPRAMEPTFETARMYLNGRLAEDVQRVFGVTTFEFG